MGTIPGLYDGVKAQSFLSLEDTVSAVACLSGWVGGGDSDRVARGQGSASPPSSSGSLPNGVLGVWPCPPALLPLTKAFMQPLRTSLRTDPAAGRCLAPGEASQELKTGRSGKAELYGTQPTQTRLEGRGAGSPFHSGLVQSKKTLLEFYFDNFRNYLMTLTLMLVIKIFKTSKLKKIWFHLKFI